MVEATIDIGIPEYAPNKLIGDKAYNCGELDQRLPDERDIQMVAPHRKTQETENPRWT